MAPDANDFAAVETGSLLSYRESPELSPDGSEAVRIAAPARVPVRGRLPLCGTVRLHHGRFGLASHAQEAYLVAVDAATGQLFAGSALLDFGMPTPPDPDDVAPPIELGEGLVTTWFNSDLFAVLDLPRRPGRWHVHAFVRSFASPGIAIDIGEEEA